MATLRLQSPPVRHLSQDQRSTRRTRSIQTIAPSSHSRHRLVLFELLGVRSELDPWIVKIPDDDLQILSCQESMPGKCLYEAIAKFLDGLGSGCGDDCSRDMTS